MLLFVYGTFLFLFSCLSTKRGASLFHFSSKVFVILGVGYRILYTGVRRVTESFRSPDQMMCHSSVGTVECYGSGKRRNSLGYHCPLQSAAQDEKEKRRKRERERKIKPCFASWIGPINEDSRKREECRKGGHCLSIKWLVGSSRRPGRGRHEESGSVPSGARIRTEVESPSSRKDREKWS